ncbi:ABC transporter ATP-binding protein [Mycoplasmatota bacterium zrk1]
MEYVIEMLNITKEFPGIKACDNVTLQLKSGEVHALLGENGAGKSTLMSVLFGLYHAEEGQIKVHGNVENIKSPLDANRLHIGMVHQHFKLVHNFTVAENIVLGMEETKYGFLSMDGAIERINELSEKYKLKIDPNAKIEDISVGMQQRVEILKMLYRDAEILIFDEPTAVLTPQEIDELMKILRDLIKEDKSIILITHKLDEIKAVADRCTVLRKGKYIGTVNVKETSKGKMAEMMVGRKVSFEVDKKPATPGSTILKVDKLTKKSDTDKNVFTDVSFEIKAGEIFCLAGIEGNGQTQIIEAITGLANFSSGKLEFNGNDISGFSIRKRTLSGIGHIPEDRHKHGLVLNYTMKENMVLQTYFTDEFQRYGFLKFDAINKKADDLIQRFDVRSGQGRESIARGMSGGNQQKVIVAREMDRLPDLLIAVQPTRGLDVGAIEYIHDQLIKHRDSGKSVLLVSLELDEVLNVSDRIAVVHGGEIMAIVNTDETTKEQLGLYMAGSH